MKYDDLLSVPYKEGGRDKDGMDCYGYVLELTRRNGKPLKDISEKSVPERELENIQSHVNLKEISADEIQYGDILQCVYDGNLHICFILGKRLVTHMTENGPRETPMIAFRGKRYWRITDE